MPKPIPKFTNFDYVLKDDREKPAPQTAFILRPLTGAQRLQVVELVSNGQSANSFLLAVRFGLRGWKNFTDETGDVPFAEGLMELNIDRLSADDIMELATAIKDASVIGSTERKN